MDQQIRKPEAKVTLKNRSAAVGRGTDKNMNDC